MGEEKSRSLTRTEFLRASSTSEADPSLPTYVRHGARKELE